MKGDLKQNRRDFLKTSSAGAATLALSSRLASAGASKGCAWTQGMQVNPAIDNLRVVCCEDPAMIAELPSRWGFSYQNDMTDNEQIGHNMDEMAKALAQKDSPAEAWATIFRSGKSWNQTLAAIKVNTINTRNMPRIAVVGKVCQVLIDLGVLAQRIIIYDSCTNRGNAHPDTYEPYVGNGLPEGVVVSDYGNALGGDLQDHPAPGYGNKRCVELIANGTVDILVNVAVNKGHSGWNGECTLCMKNHYGTFEPASHSDAGYITGINKSEAIVGGNPVRQQLCIVDSLVAGYNGPSGSPDQRPDRLVMGTFAGAVDYLTAIRIRRDIMGVNANDIVPRFLTDFGYTESEFADLNVIDVPPFDPTGVREHTVARNEHKAVRVYIANSRFRPAASAILLNVQPDSPVEVEIYRSDGALVRSLKASSKKAIAWDGRDSGGAVVGKGMYLVKATVGGAAGSGKLLLR